MDNIIYTYHRSPLAFVFEWNQEGEVQDLTVTWSENAPFEVRKAFLQDFYEVDSPNIGQILGLPTWISENEALIVMVGDDPENIEQSAWGKAGQDAEDIAWDQEMHDRYYDNLGEG